MCLGMTPSSDSPHIPTDTPEPHDSDTNPTWHNTGESGLNTPVGPDGERGAQADSMEAVDGCDECDRRTRACRRSIWTYVSRNRAKYRNPLYSPTAETFGGEALGVTSSVSEQVPLSSGPPRFSRSSSTPIHGGGTYYTATAGMSGVSAETVDFGDDSDDDDHGHKGHGQGRGECRTDEASRRLVGEPQKDGCGRTLDKGKGTCSMSSGEDDSGGSSESVGPTQLFVVAPPSLPSLDRLPDPPNCGGGGEKGSWSSHAVLVASTTANHLDMSATGMDTHWSGAPRSSGMHSAMAASTVIDSTQPFEATLCRPTRLLRPCFDLQGLAVWENVHFSGIPMPRTFTAASSTYTRGLEVLHREEQSRSRALEVQVRRQERAIEELSVQLHAEKKRAMHLEDKLTHAVAAAADAKRMAAVRSVSDDDLDGDDYVLFGETEQQLFRCVDQKEENRSRILSTGLLIEDYMRG